MIPFARSLVDWLDDRTGVRQLVQEALYERVPGGARWRYVWGSTLVVAFLTQLVTGVFLWMAYSPSTQTAWESVFYIQFEMTGGWLLRGIHHFMAQAMVVLLALHLVQVVWDGAYRAPRELNFVLGMVLMLIVMGLSLTGYLLPWDQKGYWATNVSTELASQAPLAGAAIKKLAVGGSHYGHQTLTRFFALHAGVLPGLLILVLTLHVALFRRHGLHAKDPARAPDAMFWPDQLLKDTVASLGVLLAVIVLTLQFGGADLAAPADPANPYNAARPEWYFLFLFQFLKWFPGEAEVWGAFIIPGLVVTVMFLMPWIGRTRGGHLLNVAFLLLLMGGAVLLTLGAVRDDNYARWYEKTDATQSKYEASQAYLRAKREAHREAERVIALAKSPSKIPPTGALTLVYDDPYLQGPKLFRRHCAGCHNYLDPSQPEAETNLVNPSPTASNLFGVGSRAWVAGILDPQQIAGPHFFGYKGSPFVEEDRGGMVDWVRENIGEVEDNQRKALSEQIKKVVVALSAEAQLPRQQAQDKQQSDSIAQDVQIIQEEIGCTDCHKFHDAGELGEGPDLTGYMSRAWLLDFVSNPAVERFYGDQNDRMPAFAAHDDPRLNQLDEKSLGLIVDWLRGDWQHAEKADDASTEP